jgi:hypothetical protein
MTLTSIGWRGTIGESEIAELLSLAGVRSSVKSETDWKPTAVAGNRQVAIAAGVGYAAFIRSFSDESVVLSLDAPLAGQWYLIVNRRTWSSRSSEFLALAGPTTSSATPLKPPLVFPAEYADRPGDEFDQEICWAWINAGTTVVRIWDVREPPLSVRLPDAHGFMSDGPHTAVYSFSDYIAGSGGSEGYDIPSTPILQPGATPHAAELFTPRPGGVVLRKPGIYSATFRARLEYPVVNRSFAQIGIAGLGYRQGMPNGEDGVLCTVSGIPTFEKDVVLDMGVYYIFAAPRRIVYENRLAITYHGPQGS